MSNKAITWAYGQRGLKAGAKFVLVTLADMADQDHSCYPGIDTLADLTGFGATAVRGHIDKLIATGFITTERRHKRNGARTSDRYYLQLDSTARSVPEMGESALQNVTPESDATSEEPNAGIRNDLAPENVAPNAGIRRAYKDEPSGEPSGLNPSTGTLPVRHLSETGAPARIDDEDLANLCREQLNLVGVDFAKVRRAIGIATGRVAGPSDVVRISLTVLENSTGLVKNPTGYVLSSVRDEWPRWQKYLDELAAS